MPHGTTPSGVGSCGNAVATRGVGLLTCPCPRSASRHWASPPLGIASRFALSPRLLFRLWVPSAFGHPSALRRRVSPHQLPAHSGPTFRAHGPLWVCSVPRGRGGGVAWSHLHKTTSARAPSSRAASFRTATATRAGLATAPAPFPRPLPRALRSILACTGAPQGVVCAARGALHAPHMRRITYRVNRVQ